jgi:hypothetical protein
MWQRRPAHWSHIFRNNRGLIAMHRGLADEMLADCESKNSNIFSMLNTDASFFARIAETLALI